MMNKPNTDLAEGGESDLEEGDARQSEDGEDSGSDSMDYGDEQPKKAGRRRRQVTEVFDVSKAA